MSLRKRLSLHQRIRRDKVFDIRELRELVEYEMRDWGPRMRLVKSLGEPTMGLGFAGIVVPNNEVVSTPASVSSQTEISIMGTLASTGASTWMYIPPGNFRAPQSWRIWASGTYSTGATTTTITWTTRMGTTTTASSNASIGATGAMAPGSVNVGGTGASVTAVPWWYEAHLTITKPGTTGTALGSFNIAMPTGANPSTNTLSAVAGTGSAGITVDTTQGAFWNIGITSSASPTTGVQLQQFMIVAWD